VEYQAHPLSTGKAVCQVDNEPAQVSQCFPPQQPYWALFVESSGRWANATGGFTEASCTTATPWDGITSLLQTLRRTAAARPLIHAAGA